jgi:hypothetical protein
MKLLHMESFPQTVAHWPLERSTTGVYDVLPVVVLQVIAASRLFYALHQVPQATCQSIVALPAVAHGLLALKLLQTSFFADFNLQIQPKIE